jgi:nucleoside-diphosphate-sugar epimerase
MLLAVLAMARAIALRVLLAAANTSTVRRVVMTSSIDAIRFSDTPADSRLRTEADWSSAERSDANAKGKLNAEQAAWHFVRDSRLELVTVNPGLVLGPLLHAERTTSLEVVRLLGTRSMPMVPVSGSPVTDVRDVAVAHRRAMEIPHAADNRYIVAGEPMWMGEIADVLATEFEPARIPDSNAFDALLAHVDGRPVRPDGAAHA